MLTDDKRSARVREALQSLADAFDYGTPCDSEMAIGVIEAELHRLTAALAEQTALREKAEAEVARWRNLHSERKDNDRVGFRTCSGSVSSGGKVVLDEPPQEGE